MKRLSGGIDVGSESHHIIILDDEKAKGGQVSTFDITYSNTKNE